MIAVIFAITVIVVIYLILKQYNKQHEDIFSIEQLKQMATTSEIARGLLFAKQHFEKSKEIMKSIDLSDLLSYNLSFAEELGKCFETNEIVAQFNNSELDKANEIIYFLLKISK
eukprot:TRINITY_DN8037_c0_g1_i1.p1 TRINITY_DN8037_c0_g1~~TRINITY_DN8037_c0_g1_i1.p1  ORF type:complete len:114 (+),score=23.58 TRINITY_DN8037_c0_g1_i1:29-370(+)